MGYTKNLTVANSSQSANLVQACAPELNGDSQIIVECVAVDTGFTKYDLVSVWPSASGWICDSIVNDADQYVGIVQDTPSSAADRVNVCMGGFTYANPCSAMTVTAWGTEIGICSNELDPIGGGDTSITTRHLGWPVTSGAVTTTTGSFMIFMDRPWNLIDTTTA